jgi:hypothetical protein
LPGYDLKNATGEIISKSISVEDWVQLPEWLTDCLVCIDEVEDHFNAQSWQAIIVRLFTGIFGQRRKRHMGIIYTLQFFEELPKLMRKKTHYVYECVDAARYNEIKISNGDSPVVGGALTYTTIIDNYGKHFPFIPGYRHNGPIYRNQKYFGRYETETKTDIMSQFTKVEIKRKVVSIDLNNDGVTTGAESIESQRLYENAKNGLVAAFEKNKDALKGMAYWRAAGLDMRNPAHQKIAAELNDVLGVEKTTNGVYKRIKRS